MAVWICLLLLQKVAVFSFKANSIESEQWGSVVNCHSAIVIYTKEIR